MPNAVVEENRVLDSQTAWGQTSQAAAVPPSGSGRKAGRSRRRGKNPQGNSEMALRSVSEVLEPETFSSNFVGADESGTAKRADSHDSPTVPDTPESLSFVALVSGVSFNADGECKIALESFDLENVIKLRNYRNRYITVRII